MNFPVAWLFSGVAVVVVSMPLSATASSAVQGQNASSPPIACEIRQRAWCIHNGSVEITVLQPAQGDPPGQAWILRDVNFPDSPLAIIEPRGCRKALSDTVTAVDFVRGVPWHDKTWDQMTIRLRSDGSCDLKLLLSPFESPEREWAFTGGRALLLACSDDQCTPKSPTPADVTAQYKSRYIKRP